MAKYDDVIDVARELFSKYGFRKVSMEEIAKKANVTKKTIYHYFKDKRELFCYFINEELDNIKNQIVHNDNKNEAYVDTITDNINLLLSLSKQNELLNTLIKERKENTIDDNNFFQVYEQKIINFIEERLKEEIAKKNIRNCDSKLTAFIIYKMIFSLMFEYEGEINNEKIIQEIKNILMNGLLIKGGI